MGSIDCFYSWRNMNANTMLSQLDRFLCLIELVELYPLKDVQSLLRPLSDHMPIIWATNEGQQRPTYFKVDRSWLREAGFKEERENVVHA